MWPPRVGTQGITITSPPNIQLMGFRTENQSGQYNKGTKAIVSLKTQRSPLERGQSYTLMIQESSSLRPGLLISLDAHKIRIKSSIKEESFTSSFKLFLKVDF